MKTTGILLAAAALLTFGAAAPSPAAAYDPVAKAAGELKQRPVYVDPDLGHLLKAEDRAKLETGLKKLRTPVYVAVLPGVPQGFINDARIRDLAKKTGRNGAYILVMDDGCFGVNTQTLPKKKPLEIPQQCERNSASIRDLALTYARATDRLADAPPGKLTGSTTWDDPYEEDPADAAAAKAAERPDDRLTADDWGKILTALIPGALVGGYVLRPLVILLVRLVRRRPTTPPRSVRRARAALDARLEGVR
ncbi:hypothetical protein [Streptomyces sp. NPDC020681]|uniref:hypothetical protein n=1 Tax=Streptomyces sp. NPDC020681 TaxID=3365083 RepID=UPI0037A86A13